MTSLYLLTGFLGAGKTTFLKKLISRFSNKKIALVINEFGAQGVDGTLLQGKADTLLEVNNGSIFCACRLEQFAAAVAAAVDTKPDVLFVEASGLSDPSNIKKITDRIEFSSVEYKGAICLADAVNFHKVFKTASVVKKQLQYSDIAVVNKIDSVDQTQLENVKEILFEFFSQDKIYYTTFGKIDDSLFSAISELSPSKTGAAYMTEDVSIRKYSLIPEEMADKDKLFSVIKMIAAESWRVKGFVEIEGVMYLIDCTNGNFSARPYEDSVDAESGIINVLSSGNLKTEQVIKEATIKYPGVVKEVN